MLLLICNLIQYFDQGRLHKTLIEKHHGSIQDVFICSCCCCCCCPLFTGIPTAAPKHVYHSKAPIGSHSKPALLITIAVPVNRKTECSGHAGHMDKKTQKQYNSSAEKSNIICFVFVVTVRGVVMLSSLML